MSFEELLPEVISMPNTGKFQSVQFLQEQLVKEEDLHCVRRFVGCIQRSECAHLLVTVMPMLTLKNFST